MLINTEINDFKITKQVGCGAYGLVFHAVEQGTGKEYAIKATIKKWDPQLGVTGTETNISTILQTQLYHFFKSFQHKLFLPKVDLESITALSEEQLKYAPHYREIKLHLKVHSHRNVVTIHQVLESSLATFIVLDYYGCDLFTAIVKQQRFSCNGLLIKKVFLQLCEVLFYCHRSGVFHCDLKPENILLDDNGNVQLCDFGLATSVELAYSLHVGSPYYMAPERLSVSKYPQQVPTAPGDIWSMGVILINLVFIRNPWMRADRSMDNTFQYFVTNPKVLQNILPLTDELCEIILSMLKLDPLDRASIPEIIEAVANCRHFTSTGPLMEVERLSVDQCKSFLADDHSMLISNAEDGYNSEDQGISTECNGYRSDDDERYQYYTSRNSFLRNWSGYYEYIPTTPERVPDFCMGKGYSSDRWQLQF